MSKTFNLSLVLDEKGKNRIDLVTTDNLSELDDFIMSNFVTTKDVREKYKEAIDIFYQKNKELMATFKRKWRGSVVIVYDDNGVLTKIPMMYKDGRTIKSLNECLEIFNLTIHDKKKMKYLVDNKPGIFTGEELNYFYRANYYVNYTQYTKKDKKAYEDFIDLFQKRMTICDDETLYCHFRSLMDYFDFGIGKNKEYVKVTSVEADKLSEMEKDMLYHKLFHGNGEIVKYSEIKTPEREGVEVLDSAPEEFEYVFYKALDTGDFDKLYDMYSIEEIEKYTNLLERKRK